MKKPIAFLFLVLSLPIWALELPTVFTDHMVLQRGQQVPVWGTADASASVVVEFAGQKQSTKADADGNWRANLKPLKASKTSRNMTVVSGSNKIEIKDILVGEVWLCSGQSNMEWSMKQSSNAAKAIAAANHPHLRLYDTPRSGVATPNKKINAKWKTCTSANVTNFSAVAYYFGLKLQQELDVPVGLLLSAWGGTRIEPWTPPVGFEGVESLKSINHQVQSALPTSPVYQKKFQGYMSAMQKWMKQAEVSNKNRQAVPTPPVFPKDIVLGGNRQTATKLYNGMIHAHIPFAIKGAIWYQGESNYREGHIYTDKTKALVQGWRKLWGYDFPYYFVQIAPYIYGKDAPEKLAVFWEAQANIVKQIPKTGMVVVSDVTTLKNIHPPNKLVPGTRLALHALANDYGKKVICTGPVFKKLEVSKGALLVHFDVAEGLKTRDGKAPDWFEVAGKDGKFHKAIAKIKGSTVILSSDKVAAPLAMRFAWHKLATPNLTNKSGIPAETFRAGKIPAPANPASTRVKEASGFRVVYQIDVPIGADYSKSAPAYQIDNSGKKSEAFSRVGYFLELTKEDSSIDYAFASMDKFTDNLKQIGIPTASSGGKFMQKVANLTVRSNVSGVSACTSSSGGNIEFWPGNYGAPNGSKITHGSDTIFDFADQGADPTPGYGSMQVHQWDKKQTVFALNHWGVKGTVDVGFGNSTGKTRDWTFTGSGSRYKKITLVVMVK